MRFFRYDSPFWSVTSRMFDLMALNLLWVLTSLPLVTIGAATTALHAVAAPLARGESPPVVRSYFRAFAQNFRRSTLLWLASVLALGWLGLGVYVCADLSIPLLRLAVVPEAALLILALLGVTALFPVCAHYPGGALETLRRALYLALLRLPWTALLLLTAAAPVAITLLVRPAFPIMLFYWIFFGVGGVAFVQAHILRRFLPPQRNLERKS